MMDHGSWAMMRKGAQDTPTVRPRCTGCARAPPARPPPPAFSHTVMPAKLLIPLSNRQQQPLQPVFKPPLRRLAP